MVKVTADNVNVYYVEWRDTRRQQGSDVWSVRAAGGATGGGCPKARQRREWQGQDRRNRCVKVGVLVVIGERDAGPRRTGERSARAGELKCQLRAALAARRGSIWAVRPTTGRSYYGTGAVTAG
jgi:hypothetical protein